MPDLLVLIAQHITNSPDLNLRLTRCHNIQSLIACHFYDPPRVPDKLLEQHASWYLPDKHHATFSSSQQYRLRRINLKANDLISETALEGRRLLIEAPDVYYGFYGLGGDQLFAVGAVGSWSGNWVRVFEGGGEQR